MSDFEIIELTFKSPTDRIVPHVLKCNLTWNISELKKFLSENYPCKPSIESQKIIFSGKLLKNEQILNDIFQSKSQAIVHFICQPTIDIPKKEEKLDNNTKVDEELYKEYHNYLQGFYSTQAQSYAALTPYQQMMWWNQMYMQSYCNNYYNQFGTSNVTQENSAVVHRQVSSSDNTVVQDNRGQGGDNGRENNVGGGGGMQNVVAAAFNGMADNDNLNDGGLGAAEGEPRDVLHYFYMMVRLALLLLVCYYYSSFFSIVATFMLFLLFVGVNIFRRNNPAVTPPPIEIRQQDPTAPQSVNENSTQNKPETATEMKEGEEREQAAENVPITTGVTSSTQDIATDYPSFVNKLVHVAHTSIQFVVTFFLTLFPDPVVDIEPN